MVYTQQDKINCIDKIYTVKFRSIHSKQVIKEFFYQKIYSVGVLAEWFKADDLRSSLARGVGSNPTDTKVGKTDKTQYEVKFILGIRVYTAKNLQKNNIFFRNYTL